MQVVKVFVYAWSWSSPTVEKGKATASTLSVIFKNGGNDDMHNTKISVIDSAGLEITPQSQNLQDIAKGGTKSTSFSVKAPSSATIGMKTISFKIDYDDFRGLSHSETQTASIEVTKLGTSITLGLQPASVKGGGSTTITAKLTDGNNNPLPDKDINFFIGTTPITSATTDSTGNAIKTYTANLDAGNYVVKASYSGSTDYGSSSATSNLVMNPFDTTLIIDAPSATQGKECTIKATLKDEKNSPLQNFNVDFYIYEASAWKKMGSGKTDSNGIVSLQYSPSTTGSFQVKTVFSGTTNYGQSSSTPANLNVAMDYTPYLIAGGIGVIAIVGMAVYITRTRKKVAQSIERKQESSLRIDEPKPVEKAKIELEKERIAEMLKTFKEKYDKGEIDENTYKKLKNKYEKELAELG